MNEQPLRGGASGTPLLDPAVARREAIAARRRLIESSPRDLEWACSNARAEAIGVAQLRERERW